jgi:pyridoxal phosphate enzyme (YggS family)
VFDPAALRARLESVRDRIARAAGRARRDPSSVRLIAVSKTFPADAVRAAADAGQVDFGENKVQEGLEKIGAVSGLGLRWHLIGHLQSNKARKAAEHFDMIHSIDRALLLTKLDEAAQAAGRTLNLLIQVDLAGEATKHGARPDDVFAVLEKARECRAVRVAGLMLIPPAVAEPEAARPHFTALRRLRDDLLARGANQSMLGDLSMGMSYDFEVAIEEGATLIRVGSAIFGERDPV